MKRILSLFCAVILMLSLITGCSSAKKEARSTGSAPMQQNAAKDNANYDVVTTTGSNAKYTAEGEAQRNASAEKPAAANSATAVAGTGSSNSSMSNAILSQRKIIRNANISVEVEDFDKAYGQIKSMIGAFGFIQESNIKKEKIYVNSKEKLLTKGVIILRVDKDKFESVLTDVKGLGLLMDESIKSDDVTEKFFDTESRLRLLKFEESRLEQFLMKLTDPDTIFKTESRLTDIRHEIEGLTGTLKKWSDLVELSTITINLSEKRPDAGQIQKESYWSKLSSSFTDSIKGTLSFCGAVLIALVQAIPVLLLLALVAFLALWVYRKFFKKPGNTDKKDMDVQ